MIVKNYSKLNLDDALNELAKAQKAKLIPKLILSIVLLITGLLVIIFSNSSKDISYLISGIIFLLFGLIYLIYTLISIYKLPNKVKKDNEEVIKYGITYEYEFKEQSFIAISEVGTRKRKIKYKYNVITKVFEYNKYYVLRLSTNEFFMVNKNGFTESKLEEFFIKNLKTNKLKIVKRG